MTKQKDIKGRLQLTLIALIFFGPLILAAWLYFSGQGLQPRGRTNHGTLLEPIVNVLEALPESAIAAHVGTHWLLIYRNEGGCDDSCKHALYNLRQSRLMLGNDMDRLERVFLHGETPPDTVFLADEHAGLVNLHDSGLHELLENKKPADLAAGGYFLVDPLGNLVMYFRPGIDPGAMVEDIEHLLRLSRIG